jgi:two-component system, cell cycle response regulator DivK
MDIHPPALGAFAAKRRIRADSKLRDVPIIAVTSFALSDHEAEARAAGCDKCVRKPVNPRQRPAMVDKVLL